MKFEKGQSGNPSGRPKGSKNKATNDLRSRISTFLESEFLSIKKAYASLSAEKKMKFFVDLLSYSVPKLSNTKMDIELENLTDEQLTVIINGLKKDAIEQAAKVRVQNSNALMYDELKNLSDEQLKVMINEPMEKLK
jgi:hypothetical protein